jgi:hypothetical protein
MPSQVIRFASLVPSVPVTGYHCTNTFRRNAVLQLWSSGWSMKEIAGLSGLPLVKVAQIIGSRLRGTTPLDNQQIEELISRR